MMLNDGRISGCEATCGAVVDRVEILKVLVHRLQDLGRPGVDSLADLVQPAAPQQLQILQREAGDVRLVVA